MFFCTKTCVFNVLNGIWEVWGCPGGGGGPYEEIPSNFGRVWSYRTWGKLIFMFFGNIGKSLHHQIPPNWSPGLQIGPRICFKARAPSQELSNKLIFQKMTPTKTIFSRKLDNLPKSPFLMKWFPFLCFFLGPMGPGTTWAAIGGRPWSIPRSPRLSRRIR